MFSKLASETSSWERRWRRQPRWISFLGWIGVGVLLGVPQFYQKFRHSSPILLDTIRVDVLQADSLELLALPGMSPWKVSRLLRVRESMGGFWDTTEVRLALGDSSLWQRIAPFIKVSPPSTLFPHPLSLNAADSASLVEARLCRPSLAGRLIRYRYKLRGFSDWAQIDSFRGLNLIERHRLRHYTVIGEASKSKQQKQVSFLRVEINSASAELLEKVPGIGEKTAHRIVKYREKLGFFVSVDQLSEVWGMRPENLARARPYLYVGRLPPPCLSLRKAPAESLAAHPYISWRLAKELTRRRKVWGEAPIPPSEWHTWLPDSVRARLIPYLTGD